MKQEKNSNELVMMCFIIAILFFFFGMAFERQTWTECSEMNTFRQVNRIFYKVTPVYCGKIGEECK